MSENASAPKLRQSVFKGNKENNGGVEYLAYCIAPDETHDKTGWSYKNLAAGNDCFRARVAREHANRKVFKALAPAVASSSMVIAERKDVNSPIYLPYGVTILRSPDPADGVAIEPGEGWSGSFAGCGLLVACGDGICVPAHAGRAGLVGEHTIVDSIARYFWRKGVPLGRVSLRLLFPIDPEIFTHPLNHPNPKWAAVNRQLAETLHGKYGPEVMKGTEGKINLDLLVKAAARPHGFKEVGSAKMISSGSGIITTREPGFEDSRNLVILVRKA